MWKKIIKWAIIIQVGGMLLGVCVWFLEREGYKERRVPEIENKENMSLDERLEERKHLEYERDAAKVKRAVPSILRHRVFDTEIYDSYTSYSASPLNENQIEFSFINDTIAVRRDKRVNLAKIYKMQINDILLMFSGFGELQVHSPTRFTGNIPEPLTFSLYGTSINDGLIGKTENGNNYYFLHTTRKRYSDYYNSGNITYIMQFLSSALYEECDNLWQLTKDTLDYKRGRLFAGTISQTKGECDFYGISDTIYRSAVRVVDKNELNRQLMSDVSPIYVMLQDIDRAQLQQYRKDANVIVYDGWKAGNRSYKLFIPLFILMTILLLCGIFGRDKQARVDTWWSVTAKIVLEIICLLELWVITTGAERGAWILTESYNLMFLVNLILILAFIFIQFSLTMQVKEFLEEVNSTHAKRSSGWNYFMVTIFVVVTQYVINYIATKIYRVDVPYWVSATSLFASIYIGSIPSIIDVLKHSEKRASMKLFYIIVIPMQFVLFVITYIVMFVMSGIGRSSSSNNEECEMIDEHGRTIRGNSSGGTFYANDGRTFIQNGNGDWYQHD